MNMRSTLLALSLILSPVALLAGPGAQAWQHPAKAQAAAPAPTGCSCCGTHGCPMAVAAK